MNYNLRLETLFEHKEEQKNLLVLFEPEDKDLSNGRGEYSILVEDNKVIFLIVASDAVALRAITTSISKTLDIYERTTKLVKGDE